MKKQIVNNPDNIVLVVHLWLEVAESNLWATSKSPVADLDYEDDWIMKMVDQ